MQLLGGAWLGVATLNWFTRGQSIGGIYGRPVVLCQSHAVPGDGDDIAQSGEAVARTIRC